MKFRTKVMLYTIILLVSFYMVGSCALIFVSFQYSLEKEKDAVVSTHQMVQSLIQLTGSVDEETVSNLASGLESSNSARFSGISIYESDSFDIWYENGILPYETGADDIVQMNEGQCYLIRFVVDEGRHYLQISGLIDTSVNQLVLETCQDVSNIYEMRAQQIQIYQIILLIILVVGALSAYLMAVKLTAPIGQLSKASRQIAKGNLSIRADIHTGDEIEQLAGDFNGMADEIESYIDELGEAMRRQEEFMGSFAHELKTPMTSVIGYADLLRSQNLSEEEKQEAANYIFKEGRRLESLSLKLLDLLVLKKRDFELREESVKLLVEDVLRTLRPNLEKRRIHLKSRCEKGSCLMEPDLVKSLIINLVDNAAKAMDDGGNIVVMTQMTMEGCEIVVADDGRGMAPEELSKITEAFYRVDKSRSRAQGGAGLGLALCNEIAGLHKGKMVFQSEQGKGTIVRVFLNGGRHEEQKKT